MKQQPLTLEEVWNRTVNVDKDTTAYRLAVERYGAEHPQLCELAQKIKETL